MWISLIIVCEWLFGMYWLTQSAYCEPIWGWVGSLAIKTFKIHNLIVFYVNGLPIGNRLLLQIIFSKKKKNMFIV